MQLLLPGRPPGGHSDVHSSGTSALPPRTQPEGTRAGGEGGWEGKEVGAGSSTSIPLLTRSSFGSSRRGGHLRRQMEVEPAEEIRHLPPGRLPSIQVKVGGECWMWKGGDGEKLIKGVAGLISHYDPDLILSSWGDSHLLPSLFSLAQRLGIPLKLDRERVRRAITWEEALLFLLRSDPFSGPLLSPVRALAYRSPQLFPLGSDWPGRVDRALAPHQDLPAKDGPAFPGHRHHLHANGSSPSGRHPHPLE